jgi:hypothetical protein
MATLDTLLSGQQNESYHSKDIIPLTSQDISRLPIQQEINEAAPVQHQNLFYPLIDDGLSPYIRDDEPGQILSDYFTQNTPCNNFYLFSCLGALVLLCILLLICTIYQSSTVFTLIRVK